MKQDLMLICEGTGQINETVEILKRAGICVLQTEHPQHVLAGLISESPAFIIIDLNVSEVEGFLSGAANGFFRPQPFILAAARFQSGAERASALRMGADVCIDSPIDAEEILAVIYAVVRRERRLTRFDRGRHLPRIEYRDLMIDPHRRQVTMRGEMIALTTKEYDILYLLASNKGNVLSKKQIYEAVWKDKYDNTASKLTDHIYALRRKLGLHSRDNDYIKTVFGIGYRFASTGQIT